MFPNACQHENIALDASLCFLTQKSCGSAQDCCVDLLFLPNTSAGLGTLIHVNRGVSTLLLKKCWDAIVARSASKRKILFLTLCPVFQSKNFSTLPIFFWSRFSWGLVSIYSGLEITGHLCFWSPGRVVVLHRELGTFLCLVLTLGLAQTFIVFLVSLLHLFIALHLSALCPNRKDSESSQILRGEA